MQILLQRWWCYGSFVGPEECQMGDMVGGGTVFSESHGGSVLQILHSVTQLLPLFTFHQGLHNATYFLSLHQPIIANLGPQRHFHVVGQHEGVHPLLREERPCDEGHAAHHALQNGVPPAMGQESGGGGMGQNLRLRSPRGNQKAPAFRSLYKTFG